MIFNRVPNITNIVRIPDYSKVLKTFTLSEETYKATQNCWLIGSSDSLGGTSGLAYVYVNDKSVCANDHIECMIPLKKGDVVKVNDLYSSRLAIYAMLP